MLNMFCRWTSASNGPLFTKLHRRFLLERQSFQQFFLHQTSLVSTWYISISVHEMCMMCVCACEMCEDVDTHSIIFIYIFSWTKAVNSRFNYHLLLLCHFLSNSMNVHWMYKSVSICLMHCKLFEIKYRTFETCSKFCQPYSRKSALTFSKVQSELWFNGWVSVSPQSL